MCSKVRDKFLLLCGELEPPGRGQEGVVTFLSADGVLGPEFAKEGVGCYNFILRSKYTGLVLVNREG